MAPSDLLSARASLFIGGFLCGAQLLSAQPASALSQRVTLVLDETAAAPVRDGIGNGRITPELNRDSPYVVKLQR